MTSRISTVNLERQLLHALITNKLNLQRTLGKHKADFFTNESRLFLYNLVSDYFNDKRSVLTEENFTFEIEKRFDTTRQKNKIDDYTSEYEIIKSTKTTENVDIIISKLNEVALANAIDSLVKDVYSELEKGNIKEATTLLRQKSIELKDTQKDGRVINLHTESDDWFEEVKKRHDFPEQFSGIHTGFEKFDKMTGGLFPAELTVVFGLSGKGKSTFMKALATNIRKQNRVVLHCGNEENEFQMRSKYMSADSGEKYSPFKRGSYTEDEYRRLKIYSDNARGVGAIYVYEFPQQTDATWIERAYRYLEMQGIKVDVIIIDYLDLMKPVQDAYSENDEQGKITSDLKQLAINCNCPVVTATQAGTQSEKQEKKARPFLSSADVFGTKRKVHSANTLIGIVNQTATIGVGETSEEDRKRHRMVLCVPKNRDGAIFTFRQIMDVECGKFYEDTDVDDPVMKNLERQAAEMIDETIPPEVMRTEIDVKEIAKAKKDDLMEKVNKLHREINEIQSEEEPVVQPADDFLKGFAPKTEEAKVQEKLKNIEHPAEEASEPSIRKFKKKHFPVENKDVFLADAPDANKG